MSSRSRIRNGVSDVGEEEEVEDASMREEDGDADEDAVKKEVDDALTAMTNEIDRDDSSASDEEENQQERLRKKLDRSVQKQKHLLKTGQLVGAKGKPSQVVQDAHLSSRANTQTIPAIRSIRISRSIWNGKIFTKRLLGLLTRHCLNPDDVEECDGNDAAAMDSDLDVATAFCRTFTDDLLSECPAGLVPDYNTVYGALSTAAVKAKVSKPPTQSSQEAKKATAAARAANKELPKVMKKLQAAELDANIDPTMQRVEQLDRTIKDMFLAHERKPIDLMGLLIDRESFQATVQNFFCFSFLLKDNNVRMFLDETKLPVCMPVQIPRERQPDDADDDADGADTMGVIMETVPDPTVNRGEEDKFQTIMMSLTEASWRMLVETLYGPGDE
ncbi:hypothetical protein BV898_05807 [Hypsibius exemplaris]|uniref:Non-structural maintenance of chromosomes element 4 n=1 Tax=Hypsibius exemplaris TaxID=2072580 RepID=A0A1W0WYL9_HYPEX|nr:hypothetical protein BV898_05807 [Hypsibius exemplaris]